LGKPHAVEVLRTVEREVSPYRFVRAVKAFRDGVMRVGEPVRLARVARRGAIATRTVPKTVGEIVAVLDGGASQ